jgi:hypothetical protein
MTPRAELWAECADALEPVRPDLARRLRALKKPGPKSTRDEHGLTKHNYFLADVWEEVDDAITEGGRDEGEKLAAIARRTKVPHRQLLNLHALNDYGEVKRALVLRGRITLRRY